MGQKQSKTSEPQGIFLHNKDEKILRNIKSGKGELKWKFREDVETIYDLLDVYSKEYPNRALYGTRIRIDEKTYGEYQYLTYKNYVKRKNWFAAGLKTLDLPEESFVCVWSKNRLEWKLTEDACFCYSYVLVSLYDTLGHESSEYIINQTESRIIVCAKDKIEKIFELKKSCENIQYIVSMDEDFDPDLIEQAQELGIELLTTNDLMKKGKKNFDKDNFVLPKADTLATLVYTSGTTGMPKGVMLTHKNLVAGTLGPRGIGYPATEEEAYISYLPLAHVFERIMINFLISMGGRIAFFTGDIRNLLSDLQACKPTIMAGVPRVWSRICSKVRDNVDKTKGIKKMLFEKAYQANLEKLKTNEESPFWNRLVFKKVRQVLGGSIKMLITGAAPITKEDHEFLRVVFCRNTLQGYGLSETIANGATHVFDHVSIGNTGPPKVSVEIKLIDVPEMNYFASKDQGEVCFRGGAVFQGYFKNIEKTKEALTEDGWFKTGDIGQFNPEGTLALIDRKKNIIKLSQGEYVALEKVENILSKAKSVSQIVIYGNSFQNFIVAIVIPDFESLGIPLEEQEDLCNEEEFQQKVINEINETAKTKKLFGFEIPKKYHFEHNVFSIENGLLTDTMKLKRPKINEHYEEIFKTLYQESEEEQKEKKNNKNKIKKEIDITENDEKKKEK
ncbi:long-chain-fatty-acid--coa ligase [Anaeramoeba flamelloides]|uniref:Long-chain-fatty-acid--coa ligase n=1 Tax=Anaeramoeba flamelloides TaxID=1746091 RepID=A0AAV7YUV0_9EUKA|nr:long-chain-fatty-acid--coa ligase [Anaeramoeba flamelloides]